MDADGCDCGTDSVAHPCEPRLASLLDTLHRLPATNANAELGMETTLGKADTKSARAGSQQTTPDITPGRCEGVPVTRCEVALGARASRSRSAH